MKRLLVVVVLLGPGCLVKSLEQEAADELGPEPRSPGTGPLHRPNQPCLRCHSTSDGRGGKNFAMAGTVYRFAADTVGVPGLDVEITEADANVYTAQTNEAGNFFVTIDSGLSAAERREDGELRIPAGLKFPVKVRVRDGGFYKDMRGPIWREGSCAECHMEPMSAISNGKIYVQDP